jgi:two-component system, response regulator PdtaR
VEALKILLVEDEPLILMDVEWRLQDGGHSVVAASNADRAIEILGSQSIDVILTDIDMPGSMDGLRLAAAVRDRWPPVKIVVMSGKRRPGQGEMPASARFLPKPFNQGQLMEAIDSW